MAKTGRAVLVSCLALFVSVGVMNAAYGNGDLIGEIVAKNLSTPPEISFAWSAALHQDTFVTTDLIESGAGSYFDNAKGGYMTVGTVGSHPSTTETDALDRTVFYGAGNLDEVNITYGTNNVRKYLPLDTTLKMAVGNLAVSKVELISPGDTEVQGTANAVDSLTGANLVVPASRFEDTNQDGIIMYKTYFDFNVVEGADQYYDYNRDGEIHDAKLSSSSSSDYDKSDRPFIAIYESENGQRLDLTNPPATNCDSDTCGSKTDNLWVGNPYAPVDADAATGPRGDDVEGPDGTAECDPNIHDINGFSDPLLIGEIKSLYLVTFLHLYGGQWGYTAMVTEGNFDVEVTDGRLYDWYYSTTGANPMSHRYLGVMGGHMMFKFGLNPLGEFEYLKTDVDLILRAPAPEPATGLLLLGSIGALVLRRRRRK